MFDFISGLFNNINRLNRIYYKKSLWHTLANIEDAVPQPSKLTRMLLLLLIMFARVLP